MLENSKTGLLSTNCLLQMIPRLLYYQNVSWNCPGRLLAETVQIQGREYTNSLLVQIIIFSCPVPGMLEFTGTETAREPKQAQHHAFSYVLQI